MDDDSLRTHIDGRIGWLTINRPDKFNSLTREMWSDFPGKLDELSSNPNVRVIIIRGAGIECFSTGADVDEFKERLDSEVSSDVLAPTAVAFDAIAECPTPTIAMVRGHCFGGGCAIALAADIRCVSDNSLFALTPARLGLGYPFNGIERAVQELGAANARFLFLTSEAIKYKDALRIGLAHLAYQDYELEQQTTKLAQKIAALAPLTLRSIKESIRVTQTAASGRDLESAKQFIDACWKSDDFREGLNAFMERRNPKFKGH